MKVYVYLTEFKVGITTYPAEVEGVYSTRRAAKKASKGDTYAQVIEREIED